MEINHLIAQDLYRYSSNINFAGKIKTVLSHSGARFMFLHRMCSKNPRKIFLGLFFRLWFNRLSKNRNIKIGDDVLIGPLIFVNFDVPGHSVVVGNPAKIVSHKGSKGYINKILEE